MRTPPHILSAALATAAAALAAPAVASATDFCVNDPVGCNGTPVSASDLPSTLHVAESNGSDDRFFLGAGTYDSGPLSYQSVEQVEIAGQGRADTVLRSATGIAVS